MSDGQVQCASHDGVYVLRFVGEIRYPMAPAVGRFVESLLAGHTLRGLAIDLTKTTLIDSTNLGQLARVANAMRAHSGQRVTIISSREDINIVLTSMGFRGVFDIVEDADSYQDAPHTTVETSEPTRNELANVILAAHRALMALSEDNRDKFKDMVDLLESEIC